MAVQNLKSIAITNLDASPVAALTSGLGAPARVHVDFAFITPTATASVTSTYRLVRVPSNCSIKTIIFESQAQTVGFFDLSVYYSDSTTDGTSVANQGVIVPTTGSQFFASAIDCSSAVLSTIVTNESGNYTLDLRNKELWDALALTSDPGGFFDIVAVATTTAVTTGTGKMGITVFYTKA